jgi:competence protein ComEC
MPVRFLSDAAMASTAAAAPELGVAPGIDLPEPAPRPWRLTGALASLGASAANGAERFFGARPFERGPWLAVAFAAGIAAWFVLPGRGEWLAVIASCGGIAAAAAAMLPADGGHYLLRRAVLGVALMVAAGLARSGPSPRWSVSRRSPGRW